MASRGGSGCGRPARGQALPGCSDVVRFHRSAAPLSFGRPSTEVSMFESAEVGSKVDKRHTPPACPRCASNCWQRSDAWPPPAVGGGRRRRCRRRRQGRDRQPPARWMDARGIETHSLWALTDEEKARPPMWRFWRILPPKGHSASSRLLVHAADHRSRARPHQAARTRRRARSHARLRAHARQREHAGREALAAHREKTQKRRLEKLESDPDQSWRVTKLDWQFFSTTSASHA